VNYRCAILLVLIRVSATADEQASSYFRLALQAIRGGQFTQAEADAEAGLKIDPRSAAGYDLLGIAFDGLGRRTEAERAFREAIRLNSRFLPARNDLGRSLYRTGKVQPAAREFERVLMLDPKNFTANYNLGLIARDARQFVRAAQYLEAARNASPSDASTLFALAAAYLGAGQPDRAFSISRQLVALSPDDPQIRFSLGALLLEWKQYSDAVEHLERARVAEPKNFELLHNLGQAYLHLKNFSKSEDAFLQALSARPDAVDTLYQLAVLYAGENHPDQAIQVLVRARQLSPKRPDVLLLLGREAIDEGFLDDAVDVLADAVRLDTGKIEPHLLLGEALTRKKHLEEALHQYRVVSQITPANPQAYVTLGRTFLYMRRYSDAEEALQKALSLDRANAQAAYYRGLLAADKSDYKSAGRWFAQALASDPNYFPALYDMGVNYIRQEDYTGGRDFLERAKTASPSFAQVYYRLSIVYRHLKDPERAALNFALFKKYEERDEQRRNYYPQGVLEFVKQTQDLPEPERLERYRQQLLRAVEMKPDDLNVLFMLAQVYFRTGQGQKAAEAIGKIILLQPASAQIRLRSASLLTSFHCYPEALVQLREAVEKDSQHGEARFALAALYTRMNRSHDARQVLEAGSADSAAYHNLLGRVLIQEGESARGLRELEQAVNLQPETAIYALDVLLEKGRAGGLHESRRMLEASLTKWPASGSVRFAEGLWLELAHRPEDAGRAYQRAADLSWQWEAPLLGQGHVQASLDAVDRAAMLFASSPWPHWFRALAQRKAAAGSEAAEFRRARELAAAQPEIYPALIADALRQNDCAAAVGIWARMSPLGIAPQLDPSGWCGTKQAANAPVQMLDRYAEWNMLLEMLRNRSED